MHDKLSKAFICKQCGGVYADEPVTQCDCLPDADEFYVGEITYEQTTPNSVIEPNSERKD